MRTRSADKNKRSSSGTRVHPEGCVAALRDDHVYYRDHRRRRTAQPRPTNLLTLFQLKLLLPQTDTAVTTEQNTITRRMNS